VRPEVRTPTWRHGRDRRQARSESRRQRFEEISCSRRYSFRAVPHARVLPCGFIHVVHVVNAWVIFAEGLKISARDCDLLEMLLRLAWILGLLSTRQYAARMRQNSTTRGARSAGWRARALERSCLKTGWRHAVLAGGGDPGLHVFKRAEFSVDARFNYSRPAAAATFHRLVLPKSTS